MRGLHPYALLIGFAIGMASLFALRLPALAVVVGIGSVIALNEGMKRRALAERARQEKLDDDET